MNADEARALAETNRAKLAAQELEEVIAELSVKIETYAQHGSFSATKNVPIDSALISSKRENEVIEHFENKGYTVSFSSNSLVEEAIFFVSWE